MDTLKEKDEEEQSNDIALLEQDKSTVAILQPDDLKTLNEAVEKLKSFKKKYSLKKLAVTDIDSKDQKEKLRLAIAEVRTTKTSLEKDKKEKTKPYRDTVAFLNGSYDKVIEVAEKILDPLKDHKKEVDEKIEAKEKEEEQKKEKRTNDRVAAIIAAGAAFDGQYYSVGSEQFEVPFINLGKIDFDTMTDPIFDNILKQVKEKAAIISQKEAAKKLKDEKDAAEKKEKDDKEAADREEEKKALAKQRIELRSEVVEAAGMELNEAKDTYLYKDIVSISVETIGASDKAQWDEIIGAAKSKINTYKAEAEKAKVKAERLKTRPAQLIALGMQANTQGKKYMFQNEVEVPMNYLEEADETEWQTNLEIVTAHIKQINADTEMKNARHLQLKELGLTSVVPFDLYEYKKQSVRIEDILTAEDKWKATVEETKKLIISVDNAISLQQQRHDAIAPYLVTLHDVKVNELYKLSDDEWKVVFADNKQKHADKIKKDAEDFKKQEDDAAAAKLAAANDTEKWATLIAYHKAAPSVEMGTDDFKKKYEALLAFINGLK